WSGVLSILPVEGSPGGPWTARASTLPESLHRRARALVFGAGSQVREMPLDELVCAPIANARLLDLRLRIGQGAGASLPPRGISPWYPLYRACTRRVFGKARHALFLIARITSPGPLAIRAATRQAAGEATAPPRCCMRRRQRAPVAPASPPPRRSGRL